MTTNLTPEQAQAIRDLNELMHPVPFMQFAQQAKRANWRQLDDTMNVLVAMLPENQPKQEKRAHGRKTASNVVD